METAKRVDALGPVGGRVAERVVTVRRAAGLTLAALAAKLEEVGHPMLISALSRIEKGRRRVDVDDLVALALALGVSPNDLLLSADPGPELVALAPRITMTAGSAWRWATREAPEQLAHSLFVSYSHADGTENARWLASVLREAGFAVWFDEWEISPGSSIPALIREGIESSAASFVVVSPAYAKAEDGWSSRELDAMHRLPEHPIVPVRFTGSDVPGTLGDYWSLDLAGMSESDKRARVIDAAARFAPRKTADGQGRVSPDKADSRT